MTRPTLDRRAFLRLASATTASMALPGCGELAPRTKSRPNELFIFADQLRADACGTCGGSTIASSVIAISRRGVAARVSWRFDWPAHGHASRARLCWPHDLAALEPA
jgi:hypothetical protein